MVQNLKALLTLCNDYKCNLNIKFYGDREVAFAGHSDDADAEVFNVVIYYAKNSKIKNRQFYIEVDSSKETYYGGCFPREFYLTLLSLDDLTDDELGLKPFAEETK